MGEPSKAKSKIQVWERCETEIVDLFGVYSQAFFITFYCREKGSRGEKCFLGRSCRPFVEIMVLERGLREFWAEWVRDRVPEELLSIRYHGTFASPLACAQAFNFAQTNTHAAPTKKHRTHADTNTHTHRNTDAHPAQTSRYTHTPVSYTHLTLPTIA